MRVLIVSAISALITGCGSGDFSIADPDQSLDPLDTGKVGIVRPPDSNVAESDIDTMSSDSSDAVADSGASDDTHREDTTLDTAVMADSFVSDSDVGFDSEHDSGRDTSDASPSIDTAPPSPICGNKILESGEQCDDGVGSKKCTGCESCQIREWLTSGAGKTDFGSSGLLPGVGELCVEMWVRQDPTSTGVHSLVTSYGVVPTDHLFNIVTSPGQIWVSYGTTTSDTVTLAPVGTWHHVAACRTSGPMVSMELFIDGKFLAKTPGTLAVQPDGDYFTIGHAPSDSGSSFVGSLDEVRISNTTRYHSADPAFVPQRRFTVDSQTLGLYHLDGNGSNSTGDKPLTVTGTWQNDTGYYPGLCI